MAVIKIIRMRYWCNVLFNTFPPFFYLRRYMYRVADLKRIPEVLTFCIFFFHLCRVKKTSNLSYLQQNGRAARLKKNIVKFYD